MASSAVAATVTTDRADASTVLGSTRKTEPSEALVTGWRHSAAEEQTVTVRWPAAHGFYDRPDGTYSPLLFSESVRQAAAVVSHTVFDIPLTHRLGWEYLVTQVDPAALAGTGRGATVELRLRHTDIVRRRAGSIHLTTLATASRDGVELGTARLRYSALPPAIYDRLRGSHADARQAFARALPAAPALPPASVGRTREQDVVLATGLIPYHWRLRTDTAHRVLFDHPHDHVPGMVLLEAASQAAHACAAPGGLTVPVGFDARFYRYVELDQPCWITATTADRGPAGRSIRIDGHQGDALAFRVTTESVTR
ncbi:hypothetical protein GTY54_32750 [Streptomyces sp. SID625]|nr:hypothetical protein [Streptomyces sp. SID625]